MKENESLNQIRAAAPDPEVLHAGDPLERLPGIGAKRAALLSKLGLDTVGDLLRHFPRDYEDRRVLTPIAEAVEGARIVVAAEVVKARNVQLRGRQSMAVVTLRDASGEMGATFFGRGFLANSAFRPGARGLFVGEVGTYNGPCLKNPDYELDEGLNEEPLHVGRIVPRYPLTEGITQRMLRRWVHTALQHAAAGLPDRLPAALADAHGFLPSPVALRAVHFPDELEAASHARARFAYEELLVLQIGVLYERARRHHDAQGVRHCVDGPRLAAVRSSLPFALTEAQERVVGEILSDMGGCRPMARLLQGDVGCGKTVVALHAIAAAADGGYQTALMAPTEILAEQHFLVLRDWLAPQGIEIALLTSSRTGTRALRRAVDAGKVDVVVGTHALVQESTRFQRLGLVVVDEQHRFGVAQRSTLAEKGTHPDVLHMTATPIPRTLALTLYGAMDLSVIETLPPGRSPVKTVRIPDSKVPGLYAYIRDQAAKGLQTYVVCKLIEESEVWDVTPVVRHFETLSAGPLAGLRTALLHGRLGPDEKDRLMQRFKAREIDVLFSTTVIEVGIDVPTATTMVIEDAAHFGLTQLHQLRGRVGRGTEQSYCFLLGKAPTREGKKRLEILCAHDSGFDIAEADLALRGPGELRGLRQAGVGDLRAADLLRDVRLLDQARRDAEALLAEDPALARAEHVPLASAIRVFPTPRL